MKLTLEIINDALKVLNENNVPQDKEKFIIQHNHNILEGLKNNTFTISGIKGYIMLCDIKVYDLTNQKIALYKDFEKYL